MTVDRFEIPGDLRQPLLKRLLNDLFHVRAERAAEQSGEDWDIARRMDSLGVNPHLHPEPDALELHPLPIGCPHDTPDECSELSRHLLDGLLEATARLCQRAPVLDR